MAHSMKCLRLFGVLTPQVFHPPDKFGKCLNLLTAFVCTLHRMQNFSSIHEKQTETWIHQQTNKRRNTVNIQYPLIIVLKVRRTRSVFLAIIVFFYKLRLCRVNGESAVFTKHQSHSCGCTKVAPHAALGIVILGCDIPTV